MNTGLLKQTETKTDFEGDVIGGNFTPSEIRDTLLTAIDNQINFYKLKNLALDCRYGRQSDEIWQKIEELELTRESVRAMAEKARRYGMNLKVTSRITIELDESGLLD